ncbi:MAG: hypothetical protein QOC85_3252 [Streptomyces sp.]|nr:hypothetical protein [Streptomyces sp.]
MHTNLEGEPLRLPRSAVPDGCRAWDGERARGWTDALPPGWVPVGARARYVTALTVLAPVAGDFLTTLADVRPWVAALLALQVVWAVARPEIVRFSAPALVVLLIGLAWPRPALPWAVAVPLAAVPVVSWVVAEARLRARTRQRAAALAAAGGVTAEPPGAGQPLERGTFLLSSGLLLSVLGGAVAAAAGRWELAGDGQGIRTAGWFVIGLGLTIALSGLLGRRRTVVLRRAPGPVLRVLARHDADGDTEIFAADDSAGRRPLFTVSLRDWDTADAADETDADTRDPLEGDPPELDLDALLDGFPGPLREAVLHGAPWDGAEVLLVGAAKEPGKRPVTAWSTGPVRPLSEGAARRRTTAQSRAAAREAADEERRAAAVAAVEAGAGPVRRWRAGWPDRLGVAFLVLWGCLLCWGQPGLWRYGPGAVLGLGGALLLPRKLAWRITADASGLWFNGLRRTQHIAWEHIRTVECRGTRLKLDSRRASFAEWTAHGPRWPWLERRLRSVHPYERVAAEITALWRDPALRPTGESAERERGRPLWPLGLAGAVVWAALLVFVP